MPRKRRAPKLRREPAGLADVSACERTLWATFGPRVGEGRDVYDDTGKVLYRDWSTWDAWAEFYASVRAELSPDRPWLRETSVAERLFDGWLRGADLDALRDRLVAAHHAADPRAVLR